MEHQDQRRTFSSKPCQIEGCEEVSVGSKVPLCRKHRNKTYKQNYKKKKRDAEANIEEKEIIIDDQYLLEQKYSNILQDVLSQKQMELLETPSVVSFLQCYQKEAENQKKQEEILSADLNASISLPTKNIGSTVMTSYESESIQNIENDWNQVQIFKKTS